MMQPNQSLFNKYVLEEQICEAAYGKVYRADHVWLNVLCALKVLHREIDDMDSTQLKN